MKEIHIDGQPIGGKHAPFVVAELSANHNGDIERAFAIMQAVKNAGAHAIKLQTYTADTLTLDCDKSEFKIHSGLWQGQTLYQLYQQAQTPWEWHARLFAKAKELKLCIFSSPFDLSAVEFLEDLNCPAYKIASFELVDLPLIKRVAQTAKPLILSTGMASKQEIAKAVTTAKKNGCSELILLHCISSYPAPTEQYNLKTIPDMQNHFGELVGLSDHSTNNIAAIAATALGACMIEKHVTLNKNAGGSDDSFSIEPQELASLCHDVKQTWQALGTGTGTATYQANSAEQNNRQFRRSLYVVADIAKGEILTEKNIRSIRPSLGLAPEHLTKVLGKKAKYALQKGTPLSNDLIEGFDC